MSKRKINVDKLNDTQFKNAQEKISEKIIFETNSLLSKWRPEFEAYGQKLDLQVEIAEEKDIEMPKLENNLSEFYNDSKIGIVAKDLDRIAFGMNSDLENAITSCNSLLNRYGMSCNMAFTSKAISK